MPGNGTAAGLPVGQQNAVGDTEHARCRESGGEKGEAHRARHAGATVAKSHNAPSVAKGPGLDPFQPAAALVIAAMQGSKANGENKDNVAHRAETAGVTCGTGDGAMGVEAAAYGLHPGENAGATQAHRAGWWWQQWLGSTALLCLGLVAVQWLCEHKGLSTRAELALTVAWVTGCMWLLCMALPPWHVAYVERSDTEHMAALKDIWGTDDKKKRRRGTAHPQQAQLQIQQPAQSSHAQPTLEQLSEALARMKHKYDQQQDTLVRESEDKVLAQQELQSLQEKAEAVIQEKEMLQAEYGKLKKKVNSLEKVLNTGAVRNASVKAAEKKAQQVSKAGEEGNKRRLERLRGSHPRREKDMVWFAKLSTGGAHEVDDLKKVASRALELEKMLSESELECAVLREDLDASHTDWGRTKQMLTFQLKAKDQECAAASSKVQELQAQLAGQHSRGNVNAAAILEEIRKSDLMAGLTGKVNDMGQYNERLQGIWSRFQELSEEVQELRRENFLLHRTLADWAKEDGVEQE